MEGLAELLPLLLVAAYYLLQGRRRAAQRRAAERREEAPQQPLVDPEADRSSTPFQNFLEQLEEAMAEAAGEPAPEPEPPPAAEVAPAPPVVPSRLPPAPPRRDPEFRPAAGSFDAPTPTDHVAHGFGADNPLSEEAFERRPAFSTRRRGPAPVYDPHGLAPRPPAETGGARLGDLHDRLRDPKTAREAFVLQTIFGPRGGRKADQR